MSTDSSFSSHLASKEGSPSETVSYTHLDQWLPTGVGSNFELSPTLKGLEPFKDKLTVVTGLFCDPAEANGDGGGDHSRACGSYLTGVHVKKSDSNCLLYTSRCV